MEINTLTVNKQTLNYAHIIFDNERKAKALEKSLISLRIPNRRFVVIKDGKRYYGFRMFRTKKQFFSLCLKIKEALLIG